MHETVHYVVGIIGKLL